MISIKKFFKENPVDLYLLIGFVFSLFHYTLAWVFFASMVYFVVKRDSISIIKCMMLFLIRTTSMNRIISSSLESITGIRYFVLLFFAFNLLIINWKVIVQNNILKRIIFLGMCFYIEIIVSAFNYGSYPIVSLMKASLFFLITFALIASLVKTAEDFDWVKYLKYMFLVFFALSFLTIPFMVFRTRNGHAFQGIFDHPNNFAIYASLMVALLCTPKFFKTNINVLLIICVLFMQYISECRTGLFASLIIIVIALLYQNKFEKNIKTCLITLLFVLNILLFVPGLGSKVYQKAQKFTAKGYEDNLLYSRRHQIERFYEKINYSPIFGAGFMATHNENFKTYSPRMDLYIEDGNVFLVTLGDTGIVGSVLMFMFYFSIYRYGNKKYAHLFATPFVISSGEMVFFSPNSLGFFFPILFGIFLEKSKLFSMRDGKPAGTNFPGKRLKKYLGTLCN